MVTCAIATTAWVLSFVTPGYVALSRGAKRNIYLGSGNGVFTLRQVVLDAPATAVLDTTRLLKEMTEKPFVFPAQRDARSTARGITPEPFTFAVRFASKKSAAASGINPQNQFEFCWFARVSSRPVPTINIDRVIAQGRFLEFSVSAWLLVAALALVPLVWIVRRFERTTSGRCTTCGYDLRATPDRCPECGTITPPAQLGISAIAHQ
jgi:hypothetical protein